MFRNIFINIYIKYLMHICNNGIKCSQGVNKRYLSVMAESLWPHWIYIPVTLTTL